MASTALMDSKKRLRKPVVCNVCRRRKIRCDKEKPACGACKKGNMSHMCSYDDVPFVETPARLHHSLHQYSVRSSTSTPTSVNVAAAAAAAYQDHDRLQQQRLQQQQSQFQLQLQQQQQLQHSLQAQMAAKYGAHSGQPLTGASLQSPSNGVPYMTMGAPVMPQQQQQHQWGAMQQQSPVPLQYLPQSYNPQQNLEAELDMLRQRMVQIEGQLGRLPMGMTPMQGMHPHPMAGQSTVGPPGSGSSATQRPQELPQNDELIDPVLFDDKDIFRANKFNVPQAKYLDIESDGLFESNSLVKKDSYQTLFYIHLAEYDKSLPPSKKIQISSHSDHFQRLIHNPKYHVENFIKYDVASVKELVKDVEKKLPTRKFTWLLIDRFFSNVADPYIPIFQEKQFGEELAQLLGPRDTVTDDRIKLQFDVENNTHLLNLYFLVAILRVVQISLIASISPDLEQQLLLRHSNSSGEYDRLTEILYVLVCNCDMDRASLLKASLFNLLYTKVSFKGHATSVDFTPSSLVTLAISVSINKENEIGNDETLVQGWYHLYFHYYSLSCQRGLPIFLSDEFFNLELKDMTKFGKHVVMTELYKKQSAIFRSVYKLLNKLHDFSSLNPLTVSTLRKLLNEYDNTIKEAQGRFADFKNSGLPVYQKVMFTINDNVHKLCKSNVLSLILLHYEMENTDGNDRRLQACCKQYFELAVTSFVDAFDILMNFKTYYGTGPEYMIFGYLIPLMEKLMKELSSFVLRLTLHHKPGISLVKFLLNIIDELDGFPVLKNYFSVWKLQTRTKLFLHLLKKHRKGEINIFAPKFEYKGQSVDFGTLPATFKTAKDDSWLQLDSAFDVLNDRFQSSKYNSAKNLDEVLDLMDFDEPLFDFNFFK